MKPDSIGARELPQEVDKQDGAGVQVDVNSMFVVFCSGDTEICEGDVAVNHSRSEYHHKKYDGEGSDRNCDH
ncbi:uncharacterized protein N7484_007076 [Penicillium longicatenatum]|uniref:uncharacterized protein n=1 Tax=Penicillium longicatenatum TaxID=1561947 RepID=UPI0025467FC4|nr:uncharacterized protein N7484_007076 [Penicillium longicatenatum]KAJ5639214.1 hypothetical protein N7484_007076 [Penicillium longicatenatum]